MRESDDAQLGEGVYCPLVKEGSGEAVWPARHRTNCNIHLVDAWSFHGVLQLQHPGVDAPNQGMMKGLVLIHQVPKVGIVDGCQIINEPSTEAKGLHHMRRKHPRSGWLAHNVSS